MVPFVPHLASECLSTISSEKLKWPEVLESELIETNINFVVQINGKKRALLNVQRNISEVSLMKEIKENNQELRKSLDGQQIKKTIFVSNRLINIIL